MTAINEYPGELEYEDEFEYEGEEYYETEDREAHLSEALDSAFGSAGSRPLSEQQEYQLANQLMEVSSEEELDHFTGRLMRSATSRPAKGGSQRSAHAAHTAHAGHAATRGARRPARPRTGQAHGGAHGGGHGGGFAANLGHAVSNFAHSQTGQQLGGILKDAAKEALPVVGSAVGNAILPGIGGWVGGKLGSLVGGLFELEGEFEGQELEFEAARRFVRLGATAAQQAASLADQGVAPETAAQEGMLAAARVHAPAALSGGFRPALPAGAPLPGFRARRPAQVGYGYRRHHHRHHHPVYGWPIYGGGPGYVVDAEPDGYPVDEGAPQGRWVRRGQHIVLLGA